MSKAPSSFKGSQALRLIDGLIRAFSHSVENILEITKTFDYLIYEKGLYAHAFVKPIKRIRDSFGINREILVIITSFSEQQPRTIEAAVSLINSSDARIENSLIIIIHSDAGGNSKLKLWGREFGISVVPVYVKESTAKIEDLESLLVSEFYSFDPFDVSGPVSEDGMFFGRKGEALEIARQLKRGEIKSFLGIRKIGKTSLLHRVVNDLKNDNNYTIVMIDCSQDTIAKLDAAGLMNSISESLAQVGAKNYITPSLPKNRNPDITLASESLKRQIYSFSKDIIIIFDEIDYITPSSPTNPDWIREFNIFWRNFRSIYQDIKRQGKRVSLVVCGVSGYWFREESIGGVENAALSFIPENYLTPLSEPASTAMIRELGLLCGLRFAEGVPEMIAQECGYIPFWIRKAGSYMQRQFINLDKPMDVGIEQAREILNLYVEEDGVTTSSVAIKHLFRIDAKTMVASEKIFKGEELLPSEKLTLRKYGIVRQEEKTLKFSGIMFEKAIQEYFSEPKILERTEEKNIGEKSQVGEWAEELAILSKRMNILESGLRSLILNFIRMQVIQDKSISTEERIKKSLSSDRRKQLKQYSKESLMEKLFWVELKEIIVKEWAIFDQVFSDQSRLKDVFDTLNNRPYAHAKTTDIYTIALYKRDLDWLEEKLDRL